MTQARQPSADATRTGAGPAHRHVLTDRVRPSWQTLVRLREQAAAGWAEQISHATPGSGQYLQQLLTIEEELCRRWPARYGRHQKRWIERDAALLHSDRTRRGCSLCEQNPPSTTRD